jgi:hypothetical protein
MFPMSDLRMVDLRQAGFELSAEQIFNPDSLSITDAIINIGGCTGSFISSQGLILTNHHCAFSAIQRASSKEHDFLQEGFYAKSHADEFPARGYSVRITESYRDVSRQILAAIAEETDFAAKSKAKEKRSKELIAETEKANPGKRVEISEMFPGKNYMMFIYTYLQDVRLVFAPPIGIGNFGGEEDNWVWPRHTGDFSLMRAYIGPDGKPAEYNPANVPYTPRVYLPIAGKGVAEGDLVFILGYPGRTFRHSTSHYLEYESKSRMPWIVEWYGHQIDKMEEMSQADRSVAIRLASAIKGLANTYKNYQGKLLGVKRLDLVEKRRQEETKLTGFIAADATRQARYGSVLAGIDSCYRETIARFDRDRLMDALLGSSSLLSTAYTLYQSSIEMAKPDLERDSAFMERNLLRTKERIPLSLANYYYPKDRLFLGELIEKFRALPPVQQPEGIRDLLRNKKLPGLLDGYFAKSRLKEGEWAIQQFGKSTAELLRTGDPFIALAAALYPDFQAQREFRRAHGARLEKLMADYIEIKQAYSGHSFIPDANSTLRFTYGHIRGYSPRDAVYYAPFTSLRGMIEKNTGAEPYQAPASLLKAHADGQLNPYLADGLGDVPVDILYDMDTTGGNSGSPVLNRRGELVGLNFDRAFEATINDYAWSASYSRSIGVDVRFILWVLDKISGARTLLDEITASQG